MLLANTTGGDSVNIIDANVSPANCQFSARTVSCHLSLSNYAWPPNETNYLFIKEVSKPSIANHMFPTAAQYQPGPPLNSAWVQIDGETGWSCLKSRTSWGKDATRCNTWPYYYIYWFFGGIGVTVGSASQYGSYDAHDTSLTVAPRLVTAINQDPAFPATAALDPQVPNRVNLTLKIPPAPGQCPTVSIFDSPSEGWWQGALTQSGPTFNCN
jgi:hypothetical protein